MRNGPRRAPGRTRAIVYAVLVHAAIIAALVVGFRWTKTPPALVPGKPIDAVVAEDPQKKKLEEQKRREEEAHKRAEAEQKRAEEQRRAEERRRAEDQKRHEEEARKQAEKQRQAELKRKQEEEERRRAEDQKRHEEEARKQAEAEKKRQEQEARDRAEAERRRKAAEEQLKQQLAEEEKARVEAARAARAASEAEKYQILIRQRVSRYWNRPPGAKTGLRCTVRVRLAPGGEVLQASVTHGSGNPVFDRSVEAAVFKASPLPIPSDPDLFDYFREIEFVFNPEG